jgi:preprotein translocase subunit Sec61beta
MNTKNKYGRLNSYAAGIFGILGSESSYLNIQIDKATLIFTGITLIIITIVFIIYKFANYRLYKTISAKVKNN